MEPELWDGNFHLILFHSSVEYLSANSKNIKESLNCLAKYIGNKSIDTNKANNIEDLKGIGKVAWNLVVSIYSSEWDSLYASSNKNSFRQNILFKCTPKTKPMNNGNKGNKTKTVLVCIKRILPLISEKLSKEV